MHPPGAGWRKGGESLRKRSFFQSIRIEGRFIASNHFFFALDNPPNPTARI